MRGNRATDLDGVVRSAPDALLRLALEEHRAARGDEVYATFAQYLKVKADTRF